MSNSLQFRSATEEDCTELALILDVAGRSLPSYLWSQDTRQGQSYFEYGREEIRTDTSMKCMIAIGLAVLIPRT